MARRVDALMLEIAEREPADDCRIGDRLTSLGRVDDEVDLLVFQHVSNVRPAITHLADHCTIDTRIADDPGRSTCCRQLEAERGELTRHTSERVAIGMFDAEKRASTTWQAWCRPPL